jgi:hypothetical protein
MSKKTTHEPSQGQAKHESSGKAVTVIIILCFLGIMPVLLWVTLPESSPYTSVTTSSSMVQVAADAAGMEICSSNGIPVNVPGATSAVLYQLSPGCSSPGPATTVQIATIGFSSTEAMNTAILEAQVTYKNWQATNTAAFYSGNNVIVIQGAPGNQAVQQISTSLTEQGAVRII